MAFLFNTQEIDNQFFKASIIMFDISTNKDCHSDY